MEGCFSDQPDREHGNPLKPVRTHDDVDKNWANAIVAWIRRIIRISRIFGYFCVKKTVWIVLMRLIEMIEVDGSLVGHQVVLQVKEPSMAKAKSVPGCLRRLG